jgi:hypothetical protein
VTDWVTERGLARLTQAEHQLAEAMELAEADPASSEAKARGALAQFRSAMNWLEDSEHFDRAHARLDDAGAFVRRTFGCQLHQETTRYEQRCAVALAHHRVGLSPALIIRESECSICGSDPAACSHVTGRTYDGQFCARRIKRADVLEISLVSRPAQPDARIIARRVGHAELRQALGPRWQPGIPVSCDRCLRPCGGITEYAVCPDLSGSGDCRGVAR